MHHCVDCKSERIEQVEVDDLIPVGKHSISVRVPALRCAECGTDYFEGSVMKREELLVASHLVGLGITGGAAFCFMRKIHGLRAVDLAALLDVTGETISRWETDKVPVPRCVLSTMTALAADKLVGKTDTIDRLRAMASGKTPARGMKIELKMAS